MNSYNLSRDWFDWCFENTDLITPTHTALYFFIIEHCNRLGWKDKFGLPTEMAKEAVGIKNYRTYTKAFKDLEEWGFIKVLKRSHNQYSSNVIAIAKTAKATSKALDNAMQKKVHSIASIDKPNNKEPNNSDSDLDFSKFDSTGIKEVWFDWITYRKGELKKHFRKTDTEQAAIDNLAMLSKGSFQLAAQIINQSKSNQWQGLFPLKHAMEIQTSPQAPINGQYPKPITYQDLMEQERLEQSNGLVG